MGLFSSSSTKADEAARRERLAELTTVAKRGLAAFAEVGTALESIQREELWRLVSPSWGQWCSDTLGLTADRVGQLIRAAETANTLQSMGKVPRTERAARELSGLPVEEMKAAWGEALADAGGDDPTVEQIAKAARKRKPKAKRRTTAKPASFRVPGAAVRVVPRRNGFQSYAEALRHALALAEQAEKASEQKAA